MKKQRKTFDDLEAERAASQNEKLKDMTQPGHMLVTGLIVWFACHIFGTWQGCMSAVAILFLLAMIALFIAGPGAF